MSYSPLFSEEPDITPVYNTSTPPQELVLYYMSRPSLIAVASLGKVSTFSDGLLTPVVPDRPGPAFTFAGRVIPIVANTTQDYAYTFNFDCHFPFVLKKIEFLSFHNLVTSAAPLVTWNTWGLAINRRSAQSLDTLYNKSFPTGIGAFGGAGANRFAQMADSVNFNNLIFSTGDQLRAIFTSNITLAAGGTADLMNVDACDVTSSIVLGFIKMSIIPRTEQADFEIVNRRTI